MVNKMINNKKGWVRVAEAFLAVLLIAGVVIVVSGNGDQRDEFFEMAYDAQISILREIQLDNSLRSDILYTEGEVEWEDSDFPPEVKNKIEGETPDWLEECVAKICNPGYPCQLEDSQEANVFSEFVIISADLDTYNPRVLKLFCWD